MTTRRYGPVLTLLLAGCGDALDNAATTSLSQLSDARPASASDTAADAAYPGPFAPTPPPFDWVAFCPPAPATAFAGHPLSSLGQAQEVVPGRWRGVQTNRWTGATEVALALEADGHYAGRTVSVPAGSSVFYYGTDADTPLKQYRLEDLVDSGTVTGEIDLAFWNDGHFSTPGWQGLIDDLALDVTRDRLRFELWTGAGHGPVVFDLWRCP